MIDEREGYPYLYERGLCHSFNTETNTFENSYVYIGNLIAEGRNEVEWNDYVEHLKQKEQNNEKL